MEEMTVEARAAERALARVVERAGPLDTPCWDWPGAHSGGYSYIRVGDRSRTVHRLLYEELVGEVPPGHDLHHRCEDHGCVNPYHLEPLLHAEHGLRHRRAVCRKGLHAMTAENRLSNGICRMCRRVSRRARYAVLRGAGLTAAEAQAAK